MKILKKVTLNLLYRKQLKKRADLRKPMYMKVYRGEIAEALREIELT